MSLSLFCTSCCRSHCDRTEKVCVTTQPNDAQVVIDGYDCGVTPLVVELDRRYDHTIVVEKPGYQSQQACVTSSHTGKVGSNLAMSAVGVTVGALCGLAIYGTTQWGLVSVAGMGVLGCLAGTGLGLLGAGVDLATRADCELDRNAVHFQLAQQNQN